MKHNSNAATLADLRDHAVTYLTRAVARDGITLTHAETDALGADTLDWMRSKLGLHIQWTVFDAVDAAFAASDDPRQRAMRETAIREAAELRASL